MLIYKDFDITVFWVLEILFAACRVYKCPENSLCLSLPAGPKCVCFDGFAELNGSCVGTGPIEESCTNYCLNGGTCHQTESEMPKCR